MQKIVEMYAVACGFSLEEIIGSSRRSDLSIVRQLIWKRLRDRHVSCVELTRLFNRRSHSVLVHGIQRAEGLLEIGDGTALEYQKKMDNV